MAGRSGGHIIPCMTFLKNAIAADPEYSVLFFSTDTQLDRSILALYPANFKYIPLSLDSFPGKKIVRYPSFLVQCIRSFITSFRVLRKMKAEKVVSMGGYVSLPVCAAAVVLRIPIEGFELNAVPGKALLWLAPYVRTMHVCFGEASSFFKNSLCQITAYPLRFSYEDRLARDKGLSKYGLDPAKKTLLVVGGSQGSRSINELIKDFFKKNTHRALDIQIIHQAGANNVTDLELFYKSQGCTARVFEYEHTLQFAYAAADFVIARAGAGTLFELEFFEKKTMLIPLEIKSTLHQRENAQAFVLKNPSLFTMMRHSEISKDPEKFANSLLAGLGL